MTVIAMTREMGTRGKDIASGLADRLGLEIVHHQIVERHVAERLDIDESTVHRFLEGQPSLMERWKIDRKRVARFTEEEVIERAIAGKVIIRGWGAAQLLQDIPHVISVRVCAPIETRTREMVQRLALSDRSAALHEIEQNDAAHDRLIRDRFLKDWRDPLGYDLVLNTARLPVELCVDHLERLAHNPMFEETRELRALLHDRLLATRAQTMIDSDMPRGGAVQMTAHVRGGVITINGSASRDVNVSSVAARLRAMDGVVDVKNDVRIFHHVQGT